MGTIKGGTGLHCGISQNNAQKCIGRKAAVTLLLISAISAFLLSSCSLFRERSYQVTETYSFYTEEGSKSFLVVDLPVSYGYQEVSWITVNNADEYYFEEKDEYQTLHAVISGNGSEKTVGIDYTVTLFAGELPWSMDVRDEYLQPSENIDSDNGRIIEAVSPLMVENDPYQTAKNISAFVNKTVKFDNNTSINEKTLPASEILLQKKGVCNDYANLTAAMLRAAGIPARPVSGLVFNKLVKAGDWSHPGGSHAWVEFYADGKWHFADPTWGDVYFDNPDGYHLSYGAQIADISTEGYRTQFDELLKGIEDQGYTLIAAMSAPFKFTAWSDDPYTLITPRAEVNKTTKR